MAAENKDEGAAASFGFSDVPKAEKARLVRGVFESVAGRYDLMNDAMSAGLHRVWKDIAVARLNPQPGETILDVAGGTGDLGRRMTKRVGEIQKRRGGADAAILEIDVNAAMLAAGLQRGDGEGLHWVSGDAEQLPLPDRMADAYIISFGIRNCTDIPAVLADAKRVLKRGGRFLCLEFSRLAIGALEPVYDAYSFHAIPALGKLLANDRESYQYLVESIRRFPDQERFAAMMREAGFSRVEFRNLAGGVCALHWGWAI
ncbi:MAG: class I SAM-dependent methyltransferase [Hyphomonadaceae bacterium]|nr:class I SAM-dependent methyltransferase [Hyphomonadaceae bacterium]